MSLTVHIKPDAMTAASMLQQEIAEESKRIVEASTIELQENKMGKLTAWERKDAHKSRHLNMIEKNARHALDAALIIKSTARDEACWMHSLGCSSPARTWVFEIGFDRKEMNAELDFAQVNTSKYEGAVPGFCALHMANGPAMLAERVYFSEAPIAWGYLPSRWFVKFTDGTSMRAPIQTINPKKFQPDVFASSQEQS